MACRKSYRDSTKKATGPINEFQDTSSVYENQLCFHSLALNKWKVKIK